MRAIQVKQFGGPEVLELVDLPAPTPQGPLQLLSVTASGVNYADTHQAADDYLAPQTLPFVPGAEVVVVHAGAGGVGCLAVQLARELGDRRIIATASSPEKRDLARDLGADVALDPGPVTGDSTDLRDALVEANEGRPVDIVLEMAGGRVFDASLRALAPFGRVVTYGMASRVPPTPVQPGRLIATSRSVVGFWLMHALRLPGGLRPAMEE